MIALGNAGTRPNFVEGTVCYKGIRSCEGKVFGGGGRGGRRKGFVVSRNGAKYKLSPGFHSVMLLFFDRIVTSLAR